MMVTIARAWTTLCGDRSSQGKVSRLAVALFITLFFFGAAPVPSC